jgi:hypothetical protein
VVRSTMVYLQWGESEKPIRANAIDEDRCVLSMKRRPRGVHQFFA